MIRRPPRSTRTDTLFPYTTLFRSTGTYIIGNGAVAVIDPGPDDADHVHAIRAALEGERVSHILVTHTHYDHSPAAVRLKAATGAEIVGCAQLVPDDNGQREDAGFDRAYSPDRLLKEGVCESVSRSAHERVCK